MSRSHLLLLLPLLFVGAQSAAAQSLSACDGAVCGQFALGWNGAAVDFHASSLRAGYGITGIFLSALTRYDPYSPGWDDPFLLSFDCPQPACPAGATGDPSATDWTLPSNGWSLAGGDHVASITRATPIASDHLTLWDPVSWHYDPDAWDVADADIRMSFAPLASVAPEPAAWVLAATGLALLALAGMGAKRRADH